MIPYYRTRDSRQRTNNKSIQVGYNIWVLAEACCYVVQFEPYQGVKKGKQVASSTKWRLGKNDVLRLMECLPPTASYHILMNNYFTSFCLLTHLRVNNTQATVVLNKNRLYKSNALSLGTNRQQHSLHSVL